MSPHKGRALRVSLFVLMNLFLAAALAALSIFFYSAYQSIHYNAPIGFLNFYPVEVTGDAGEFSKEDLLLVYGSKTENGLPFSAQNGSYLAVEDGRLFVLSSVQEEVAEESGVLLFKANDAGPLLRFFLTADRLFVLLIATVLGAFLLELLLCLLLLGKRKHRVGKKSADNADHTESGLSELDKYAELDYNPFPQKLYSSKVEMVEIEDYPQSSNRENAALKVGNLPVKVIPLTDGAQLIETLNGYTVTLTVKKQ